MQKKTNDTRAAERDDRGKAEGGREHAERPTPAAKKRETRDRQRLPQRGWGRDKNRNGTRGPARICTGFDITMKWMSHL